MSSLAILLLSFPALPVTSAPQRLAFVIPWLSSPQNLAPRCFGRYNRRPPPTRMTSQAVDLTSGIDKDDTLIPRQITVPSMSSAPPSELYDRSKLGLHFTLGSKVFNL